MSRFLIFLLYLCGMYCIKLDCEFAGLSMVIMSGSLWIADSIDNKNIVTMNVSDCTINLPEGVERE